ncbi:MAG: hypothetical protein IOD03_13090 [Methylocystis sp.]|nr:hypothetical protein [Methylocystis sp.]MCA3593098.1 hypothetical protein [Methylocystis sp.]
MNKSTATPTESSTSVTWMPSRISLGVAAFAVGLAAIGTQLDVGSFGLSHYFFMTQDRYALVVVAGLLVVLPRFAPRMRTGAARLLELVGRKSALLSLLSITVLVAAAGTYLVFGATAISYDEVQADFDARVFASGRLAYPVAEAWRPFVDALGPMFFLPVPNGVAWISAYWPGNAALRALFDLTIGMVWCGPFLLAVALTSTYSVARKIWPDRPDAAVIAVLLLGTSSQVLVTAMTPYAMTAHLAVNMLWLRLFLQDRPLAHAGALLLGVLGVGLHQVVFHPLFVAPFVLMLLAQFRFRLAAFYIVGYGIVSAAWIIYPEWLAWSIASGTDLADPLRSMIARWTDGNAQGRLGHSDGPALAVLNVARLVAWLNPALVMLFVVGIPVAVTRGALPRALLASTLLTGMVAMAILPYQGHGWGYRYVHGGLGTMALVAAIGWVALTDRDGVRTWAPIPIAASLASVLVLLPLNAIHAAHFVAPIREALEVVQKAPTAAVVIDDSHVPFAADLIRNKPDLSNVPKTFLLHALDSKAIAELCRRGPVSVFDDAAARRTGMIGVAERPVKTPKRIELDASCRPAGL